MIDGVRGALTGTSHFLMTHMLFADDLSHMSNDPNHMQTMLDKLRLHAQRKSSTINTQNVMCFDSHNNNLPPLFMMAHSSPTLALSNIRAWFVTDISI